MCVPAEFEHQTRQERLMTLTQVRDHHALLARSASRSAAGLDAWYAHLAEHRQAGAELRAQREAARTQRIK